MKSVKVKKRVTFECGTLFTSFLESVSGKLKPYTAEVT